MHIHAGLLSRPPQFSHKNRRCQIQHPGAANVSFAANISSFPCVSLPQPSHTLIRNLDKLIEISGDPGLYAMRGLAKIGIYDMIGALGDVNSAIRLRPSNAIFYRDRGTIKSLMKDDAGARVDFDIASELERQKGSRNQ